MEKKKIYYGWFIVAACVLMTFVALGLGNSTKGLYVTPITEELGISRGLFTITFSIREVVKAFANILFGAIAVRLGTRKVATLGFFCLAISFTLFAVSSSLWVFYAAGLFLGVGITFTSTATVSSVVNKWFVEQRGTVMGIIFAASGLGGSVFSILVGSWIENHGWRVSYGITAGIMLLMMIPMFLVLRNSPSDLGLKAYGEGKEVQTKKRKTVTWQGDSPEVLLRKPYFYMAAFGAFTFGLLTNPVVVSFPAHLTDLGMDAGFVAGASGIMYLVLAGAKIIVGRVYDKFGLRVSLVLCYATNIAGILLLLNAQNPIMAYVFVIIFAFSLPLETLMVPLLINDLFGQKSYNHFVGIFLALMSIGIAVGTPVLNFCYDLFGSYHAALIIFVILSVLAFAMLLYCTHVASKKHAVELKMAETAENN